MAGDKNIFLKGPDKCEALNVTWLANRQDILTVKFVTQGCSAATYSGLHLHIVTSHEAPLRESGGGHEANTPRQRKWYDKHRLSCQCNIVQFGKLTLSICRETGLILFSSIQNIMQRQKQLC